MIFLAGLLSSRLVREHARSAAPPRSVAFGIIAALAIVTLMAGCGAEEEEANDAALDSAARTVEEASKLEQSTTGAAAAEIDEGSIRTSLEHLTGVSPVPLAGGETAIVERGSEEGRRAAAEYMKESFEEVGIPARILEFTSNNRFGTKRGFNVEATLEGSLEGTEGEKHLWVTAHLDNVSNAGANDNATGLVSILMIAKALKQLGPSHTVHFVAYDLEEIGAVGSTRYTASIVSDIRQQKGDAAIIGNLNNDMIGYDEGGFEAVMGTCNRAGSIDEAILHAAEAIDSPLNISEDCLSRSDHQNFWDAGLPAVVMTDGAKYDGYPWYHTSEDTIDKLDLSYLRSMIQLNVAATTLLAAPES